MRIWALRAAPAAAVLVLAGCGGGSVAIRLEPYKPVAQAHLPSAAPRPRLRLDKVEDQTGGIEVVLVGPPIGQVSQATLTSPLADSLRQAVQVELGRLGLAAAEGSGEADARLDVTATSLIFNNNGARIEARVTLSLMLKNEAGRTLWVEDVKGVSHDQKARPKRLFAPVLNAAFSDAISKIGPLLKAKELPALLARPSPGGLSARSVRSDVDELPARRLSVRSKAHALVLGVRDYRQQLPEAAFADDDARLVSRYLTSALGYPEENVATLINDQAAKSDFEKYFERWLPNRVEAGDEVFVYFSGHGAPNPATGGAYLVPYDGDPTYLDQTAYPLKRMYTALAKLPAAKVTVVLDSCFSGAGGRSVLAKGARPLVTLSLPPSGSERVTVLSASASDQISNTYDEKGHGLFTYFFLKGLQENPDLKAAFDLAVPQVSRLARRQFNSDQTPQRQGGQ